MPVSPTIFLCDNGSLRPEATLALRRVALALERRLGQPVAPVSLLHSSGIDPGRLEGRAAELVEPALAEALARGVRSATVLPLFFGPSAAVTAYLPERLAALRGRHPGRELRIAAPLVRLDQPEDDRLPAALADRVRTTRRARGWSGGPVVLVDHGSPQPAVAEVRNHVAALLAQVLGEPVWPCSMESREGPAYAFNHPLLAERLRVPPCDQGRVLVAQQFLGPGRHAGPGGDLEIICAEAQRDRPGLEVAMTEPVGEDPRVIDILVDRLAEVQGDRPAPSIVPG